MINELIYWRWKNDESFKAPDFIAAGLLHLPPKGQQTVRH